MYPFVENYLVDKVTAVVCDDDDLFGLNYVHETVIEAIYIPPADCAYYSDSLFANIQKKG